MDSHNVNKRIFPTGTLTSDKVKKVKKGQDLVCIMMDDGAIFCIPYEVILSYLPGDEMYEHYRKFLS